MKRGEREDFNLTPEEFDELLDRACIERKESKKIRKFFLEKIISGGQTGADLAGLLAAKKLGLQTGGTSAPLYSTSNGREAALLKSFGLVDIALKGSWQQAYCDRTMKNVIDANATVVFRVKASSGTDKTIGYAVKGKWQTVSFSTAGSVYEFPASTSFRPVFVVLKLNQEAGEALVRFLEKHKVKVLNIAGHRAGSDLPGWQENIESFLLTHLGSSTQ